ncbi:MAG: hypothetical protein R3185_04330 [Candidatus Thermoplasmatota archaeon]|nr:hypothetical protein [Candidatus Thermoplasmatota archaeon]
MVAEDALPHESTFDGLEASLPTPVEAGPNGEIVWRPLKSAWLTHHFVGQRETHIKGGYAWDTSRYLPVLSLNEDGDPILGFARASSE